MATTLTLQPVDTDGLTPAYVAADVTGNNVTPTTTQPLILHVKNGGGSSINVIIDDPTTADPGAATAFNPDVTIAVTNAQERMIRLDVARYKNTSTGFISWTYSGVTTVTVAVFSV